MFFILKTIYINFNMDKYIDRNPDSNLGLDLLANNSKLRKIMEKTTL